MGTNRKLLPRGLALTLVAIALLATTALCAFHTINTINTDHILTVFYSWLVSATAGILLIISWVQAAVFYRSAPTIARRIVFLVVVWVALLSLLRVLSPWVRLSDRVEMLTIIDALSPGFVLSAIAAGVVLVILRNSVDRRAISLAGILIGGFALLLVILMQYPELTRTSIYPTPKTALEAKLSSLYEDVNTASVEILQSQQMGDVLVLWWRFKPTGQWTYLAQNETLELNQERWCTVVSDLTFHRTIYGSGWASPIGGRDCADGHAGFVFTGSIAYAYGANESGHMARVQWDDGQVDEVLLIDGYYLILREAVANRITKTQVTIQDVGGRTVYENLNWEP